MSNINDLIAWKIYPYEPWTRTVNDEDFNVLMEYLDENPRDELAEVSFSSKNLVINHKIILLPKKSVNTIGFPGILITPKIKSANIDETFKKIISLWTTKDSNSYICGELMVFKNSLKYSTSIKTYCGGNGFNYIDGEKIENFLIPVQYCHIDEELLSDISSK